MWKSILLNQFHDVLPGSCIEMAVKDAHVIYEVTQKRGESLWFDFLIFVSARASCYNLTPSNSELPALHFVTFVYVCCLSHLGIALLKDAVAALLDPTHSDQTTKAGVEEKEGKQTKTTKDEKEEDVREVKVEDVDEKQTSQSLCLVNTLVRFVGPPSHRLVFRTVV
jgi:hypothetical protein